MSPQCLEERQNYGSFVLEDGEQTEDDGGSLLGPHSCAPCLDCFGFELVGTDTTVVGGSENRKLKEGSMSGGFFQAFDIIF